jgi:DNA-binding PadR family transcriptional regulator
MRLTDLDPPERRLLKHVGRIDPNETWLKPSEYLAADRLEDDGLVEQGGTALRRTAAITEAGREVYRRR